jgi:tetratricopeptide (TPR) repeat protein
MPLIATSRVKPVCILIRCVTAAALISLPCAFTLAQDSALTGSLSGLVRDSHGAPVVSAGVRLVAKDTGQTLIGHTDSEGHYSFGSLREGVYTLTVEMTGYAAESIPSIYLKSKEAKTLDLTLMPAASASQAPSSRPEFFDEPQFVVSGVTDTTNLGGHGSDTVVRTQHSLAKETVELGKVPASESAAAATQEKSVRERVEREPDNAELHHLLAELDEKSANPLDAVREFERAATLNPSESYLFDWASELLLHHAPEPAIDVFARGHQLFPGSPRMLIGLGVAYFTRGENDHAIARICEAADLAPENPAPYQFLGKLAEAQNPPSDELVERLKKFASLRPENAQANYYYAVALYKRQKTSGGSNTSETIASLLDNAIRIEPNFAAAFLQRGTLHSERRDLSKAVSDFQRALAIDPSDEQAHYRLAQAYRETGQADKAKAELQLYNQASKQSAQKADDERRQIRQFVYTLRDQPAGQTQ